MSARKFVIIGSGIAGITAARTLRAHDPEANIHVYTSEFHPLGLAARYQLGRALGKGIHTPEEVLIESADSFADQNIRVEYHEVPAIFPDRHQVLRKHAARETYDALLLAVGALPRLIDVPGLHLLGVTQVGNYYDISLIEDMFPALQERGAAIVGGGFLALDLAKSLVTRGIQVTLIVRESQLGYGLIDSPMSDLIAARLKADGVRLLLNTEVRAFTGIDDAVLDTVVLSTGESLSVPMAICAVGTYAATDFLDGAGLEIDEESGAIVVDSFMRTGQPDIYAAGAGAFVDGQRARHWHTSEEQGRIAALNMLGIPTEYQFVAGHLNTQLYGIPFAYFGDTTPDANTQERTWSDPNGAGRILLEDNRIVGAALLGDAADKAEYLYARYQNRDIVLIDRLVAEVEGSQA